MEREEYSTEEASEKALKWCEEHPEWTRICDLNCDSNDLYKTWEELSERERKSWIHEFGENEAKEAWEEFGKKVCKVPYGFISGKGIFYNSVLDVPLYHNLMQVYKIG